MSQDVLPLFVKARITPPIRFFGKKKRTNLPLIFRKENRYFM